MAARRNPRTARRYKDTVKLKSAVRAQAEQEFLQLFGVDWSPRLNARYRHSTRTLTDEPDWERLQRLLKDANKLIAKLSPAGTARRMQRHELEIALWLRSYAKLLVDAEYVLLMCLSLDSDSPRHRLLSRVFSEAGTARGVTPIGDPSAPGRTLGLTTKFTARELAVISLLAGNWPDLSEEAVRGMTVAGVIQREATYLRKYARKVPKA